MIEPSKK